MENVQRLSLYINSAQSFETFSQIVRLVKSPDSKISRVILLGYEPNESSRDMVRRLRQNGVSDISFVTNLGCGCLGSGRNVDDCSLMKDLVGIPDKVVLFNKTQAPSLSSLIQSTGLSNCLVVVNAEHAEDVTLP